MFLDPPARSPGPALRPLALVARRSLWLAHDGAVAHLEVRSPTGVVELRIRVGPEGPTVHVSGGRVELDAGRALVLRADDVAIAARRTLSLTGDDGVQVEGRHLGMRATRGNVAIAANDDVRVDGERIWLNR